MRYICRITNVDKETAEDILQEVFIKIYKNLHEYDEAFTFNSWVYRITHNEAISFYRKQKVRPKTINLETDEGVDLLNMIPDDIDLREDYVKKELARQVKITIPPNHTPQ